MHVDAVVDDLDRDARGARRGGDGSGRAVVDAVHAVEGMRQDARTGVERGQRLREVGSGVSDGDGHAGVR